jgi:hypothetical protein
MVDSCYMSDTAFSIFLEGILSQQDEDGMPLLHTLIFTNGQLGQNSADLITELLPSIRELQINNI